VNFSLLKKYLRGEFVQGFVSSEEYPRISFITLTEAEDLFVTQEALFIDSREKEAFVSGHILGALNIPYEEEDGKLELDSLNISSQNTLVVYCDGSECQSSILLAKLLHEHGFEDIRVFLGGWREWSEMGLPVTEENDQK